MVQFAEAYRWGRNDKRRLQQNWDSRALASRASAWRAPPAGAQGLLCFSMLARFGLESTVLQIHQPIGIPATGFRSIERREYIESKSLLSQYEVCDRPSIMYQPYRREEKKG